MLLRHEGRAEGAARGTRVSGRHERVEPVSASHPRPTNGIAVAITVMVATLASSGRLAM
jgi:hypothetical protein